MLVAGGVKAHSDQVEQPRDLARDSGQRKLTYSLQNHCASSRSSYSVMGKQRSGSGISADVEDQNFGKFREKVSAIRIFRG